MKPTPVKNIVSEISLKRGDVFLPIFEPIINSINSILLRFPNSIELGRITIDIERDSQSEELLNPSPIKNVTIIDNGEGFHKENITSFETPHSHKNKELGGKGMGRFTCLAAFRSMEIESHFIEGGDWKHIIYTFDQENEFIRRERVVEQKEEYETKITLSNFFQPELKAASGVSIDIFVEKLMNHCLVYYLEKKLPEIVVSDKKYEQTICLNTKYEELAKEREREFDVGGQLFKAYLVRTPKRLNRKHHYVHYCANSREVGEGKSLATVNNIFSFPITKDNELHFLDVYIVSDYLNSKVSTLRNTLNIPANNENSLYSDSTISFYDIEKELALILKEEFQDFFIQTQQRFLETVKSYILQNGHQYRRFLNREDILNEIPPFADDSTIEEYLHRFSYKEIKKVEDSLKKFITAKQIDEETIKNISEQLKKKTAYDSDGLAEYMLRRRAILDLFDRFLEADEKGEYKLEKDIHNLIIPIGLSGEPSEGGHNLWLLDERFLSYGFVASDIPITKISQNSSRKEPDVIMWKEDTDILDRPTAYGSSSSGEIKSLVVFEFKRPGETAHGKNKTNSKWLLTDLVDKYFEAFLYGSGKTNYKGKTVRIEKATPKFGYIIVDKIPRELEEYNIDKGLKKTPYGTLYDINPQLNLHIEIITFHQLLEFARARHKPFFDKLFLVD